MPLNPPDIKELRAIVDWVNLSDDVRELSLKFGDVELFISRDMHGASSPALASPAPAVLPAPVPAPSLVPAAASMSPAVEPISSASSPVFAQELADDEVLITAPMVGTFYASPRPGAPTFVSVGDRVQADSVLCILEVMKLMSSIEAQIEGTVTQIFVENEQAVEYGQPLMVVTRDG